jgi:hypothetical protein
MHRPDATRARPRDAAAPPSCAAVPRPHLEVRAWARLASAPHAPPGRFSADEPARHAACARSPRRRRSARRARTPRVVVPRALTRRSRHCEVLRLVCVLGYKRLPSSSQTREIAAHRSAIAAAAGELTAPLAPAASQTLLALHWITLKLPWPRIELLNPELRLNPSRSGCATATSPPLLVGAISGLDNSINRRVVSPITPPRRMFPSSDRRSPPASPPGGGRASVWGFQSSRGP